MRFAATNGKCHCSQPGIVELRRCYLLQECKRKPACNNGDKSSQRFCTERLVESSHDKHCKCRHNKLHIYGKQRTVRKRWNAQGHCSQPSVVELRRCYLLCRFKRKFPNDSSKRSYQWFVYHWFVVSFKYKHFGSWKYDIYFYCWQWTMC